MIVSDQAEEVILMDFDVESEARRRREHYEAYEEDDHPQGHRGVQCATQ